MHSNFQKVSSELFSIKGLFSLVTLICIVLTAYFTASLGSNIFSWFFGGGSLYNASQTSKDQSNTKPDRTRTLSDYEVISQRNIFGKYPKKVKEKPVEKKTDLKLRLVGTSLGNSPFAIIENTKSKKQDVFDLKDSVFETGATLLAVYDEKIELERSGEIELLEITEGEKSKSGRKSVAGISANADESEFTVPEDELNDALANLPRLLSQARAVPFFRNGESIGMRLFAIRRNSLYEKLGLKNGDILLSVNENSLADPTEALRIFDKLKEEKSIKVEVERSGAAKSLNYSIE